MKLMKGLKGYIMPLSPSKLCALAIFTATTVFANDSSILSKERLDIFNFEKKQNLEESAKLRKDWINPITYKYAHDYGEDDLDSKKSIISINQPIFKSGGIYNAVLYANNLEKYTHLSIDIRQKTMIKDATTLLFQIHRANFSIKKQALLLKNAQIDIERKKEQVLNGFLDTSFLNDAILEANIRKNALVELKYNKTELINSFNNLASGNYKSFDLPQLQLVKEENFIDSNLEIMKQKKDIEVKDKYHLMTIAKYLPTLNFTYDYTKYHEIDNSATYSDGDNIEQYGVNVTIPLDIRVKNDIQSNKIAYLISKSNLETTKLEQTNFYKSQMAKIKMLDEKIQIAQEDYELYNSLLEIIIQEKNAELKTQSDVDTLANSQKVKSIESDIFKLDRQIELLELYAKMGGND